MLYRARLRYFVRDIDFFDFRNNVPRLLRIFLFAIVIVIFSDLLLINVLLAAAL